MVNTKLPSEMFLQSEPIGVLGPQDTLNCEMLSNNFFLFQEGKALGLALLVASLS